MKLFNALGFHWERGAVPSSVPTPSIDRVGFRFYRMLPEFIWDAIALEGNPFSFPEVKTLLDGVAVGGRKVSDQGKVLNQVKGFKHLLCLVKETQFAVTKATFTGLHDVVARNDAVERGAFRGEGRETNRTPTVDLAEHGRYSPLPTVARAPELNRIFDEGLAALNECRPFERASVFFLFGALCLFFFDANKSTSRLMMNGVLMSNGIDAISVPAAKAQTFSENMVRFYRTKTATEMIGFLLDCHPEAAQIHQRWPRPI